jgi:RHS repeat-associated protein
MSNYDPSASYFVYDDWNMIQEQITDSGLLSTNSLIWGLDLSGTLQGAGGVGGLLAVRRDSATYFTCFDANGNVTEYVHTSGIVQAHFAYDAFGNAIRKSGDLVSTFSYTFSNKYFDDETGLYYYGYRYYESKLGRWLSRDPIEEVGGVNWLAFLFNNTINGYDYNGLFLINKDWINCIGYASGLDADLQPDSDSLSSMFKKLGWVCTESASSKCNCDCETENAMMVYVYITKGNSDIRWNNLTPEQQKSEIQNIKKHHAGKDFWNDNYWPHMRSVLVRYPLKHGGYYHKYEQRYFNDTWRLDFHGIKRNCSETDGSLKSWEYVDRQKPKKGDARSSPFTGSPDGSLQNPDDYWSNFSMVLKGMCCKKPRAKTQEK